jgi:magnesium transporter
MYGIPPGQPNVAETSRTLPIETARRLLRREAYPNLVRLLRKLHGSECAELLGHLTLSEQSKVLERLPDLELATAVFTYLDEESRGKLLPVLSTARLVGMVRLLPPDDATDILGAVPAERLTEMLDQLPPTLAAEINKLLSYDPRTAGGLMTTNFFSLPETCTVAEALEQLRRAGKAETVFYVYVVDADRRLVGVISLRQLVMAEPEVTLRTLMEGDVISVGVDENQETIARLITQYDFLALPVVDREGQLAGIVTVDDIIDVISEEATEDMLRMAGVSPEEMAEGSARRAVRHRLPWLSASWLGGLLASYVIDTHAETLRNLVVLASFIPVITGMGGNAATQSLAVAVRGLATGSIDPRNFRRALIKEGRVGLSLGAIYGMLLGTVAFAWQHIPLLGVVVGVAICAAMGIAAILGGLLPLIFARFRIDPAVASGPFLTTAIDIIGLATYLTTAKLLMPL